MTTSAEAPRPARRAFVDICNQINAAEAPAFYGGHALAAIGDWMSERGARRLTLQREPDGTWSVALDIGRSNWTRCMGDQDVEAMSCSLCECVAAVFVAAEKSEAESAER